MSGGENTMYRFPSARSEFSSRRNSRMPVASTDCGCCATVICFHTPQVARSRKIPSETRMSFRKCRHSKQENATATPGKTQMKYRLKKALVPSSARTKPASGMPRNSQPMDSPSSIGGKIVSAWVVSNRTIQTMISASSSKASGNNCGKIARSSAKDGRFQKPEENLRENETISGDKSTVGTTTPTNPAISFAEGRCQGFQRRTSQSTYGARHITA